MSVISEERRLRDLVAAAAIDDPLVVAVGVLVESEVADGVDLEELLDEPLGEVATEGLPLEVPLEAELGVVLVAEPLFSRVISEEVVRLLLLVDLLVLVVELLELVS